MSQTNEQMLDNLRAAMRGMASAVAIISTRSDDGARYAMAATSVTSLSFDPPSMLVCIHRDGSFYPPIRAGRGFCINLLHHDQMVVAENCRRQPQGEGRFAGAEWEEAPDLPPMLKGAQAAILCRQTKRVPYGTHDIVVGEVERALVSGTIDPILFVDGRYRRMTLEV